MCADGVKKALKKQQKNNDSIRTEETNMINKFRSLSISDNNSNGKNKPKRYWKNVVMKMSLMKAQEMI
eukprot:8212384-Ditylum_brightwellii.AAC.1